MTTQIKELESRPQMQGSVPAVNGEPRVIYSKDTPQRHRPVRWASWAISIGAAAMLILMLVVGIVTFQRAATTTTSSRIGLRP